MALFCFGEQASQCFAGYLQRRRNHAIRYVYVAERCCRRTPKPRGAKRYADDLLPMR